MINEHKRKEQFPFIEVNLEQISFVKKKDFIYISLLLIFEQLITRYYQENNIQTRYDFHHLLFKSSLLVNRSRMINDVVNLLGQNNFSEAVL